MRFDNDDFMNFMGFRNSQIEEKIDECLAAARRGQTSVTIDQGDLTDAEAEYLKKEVRRRLEKGEY